MALKGSKPRRHRDPVTPAVYAAVRGRDRGCVAAWVRLDSFAQEEPFPEPCVGPLELDHVWSSGLGRRGPSVEWNLVMLCRRHHRWKTEHARTARLVLRGYLESHYGRIGPDGPAARG